MSTTKLLTKKFKDFFFLSTGEAFREIINSNSKLGEEIKPMYEKGELMTDQQVMDVVGEFLKDKIKVKSIIFDGVPRNKKQIELLEEFLKTYNQKIDKVIQITLTREETIKRLLSRAKIEKRSDDTKEAIEKRLKIYNEHTKPLLNIFKEKDLLYKVDGMQSVESIHNDILMILDDEDEFVGCGCSNCGCGNK